MSTEGHNCWEDCDEGPHGCVCGNDCAPPRWMTEQDEREALRDEIAHWQIGSGYYQASIGIDEARDIADHLIEQGWHRQAQITDAQADARAALEAAEEARRVE